MNLQDLTLIDWLVVIAMLISAAYLGYALGKKLNP